MSGIKRVRVLTSCTAAKRGTTGTLPAEELYRGQHHLRLMRGVDEARIAGIDVGLSIVSAGHGIVDGGDALLPYEQTFQGRSVRARRELAQELGVPAAARRVLAESADVHVVLLGEDYLMACELDQDVEPSAPVIIFCAAGTALELRPIPRVHVVALTTEDTRRFRCGLVALKGEVGGRLLTHVAHTNPNVGELLTPRLLTSLAGIRTQSAVAASTLF